MHVDISEKYVVYILHLFIYNINNLNININRNIFKIYTVCVCIYINTIYIYIYIYIHRTLIYYAKQKLLFCMRLIAINHLTALIKSKRVTILVSQIQRKRPKWLNPLNYIFLPVSVKACFESYICSDPQCNSLPCWRAAGAFRRICSTSMTIGWWWSIFSL